MKENFDEELFLGQKIISRELDHSIVTLYEKKPS